MAVRDEDFESGLTLVEGDDGIWSSPEAAPASSPRDWRSEYEREHARAERERARADAAEARCEELRWAEVDSRARAGSLKWQLDRSRSKLKAAVEETQEVRRTAKDALSLQAEVTRLEKLLSEARIEPAKHRPTSPADKARRRLRATLERAENQKATIKSLRAERGELRKEVTRLNREVTRLGKWLAREEQASERHKETIRRQYDEDIQLRAALRRLRDQSDRVRSLSEEIFWLRIALDGAKAGKETLKARLVKLRAVGATLSKLPSDEAAHLRAALRRSRRQKTTINVLSKENARLRRAVKGFQDPPRSVGRPARQASRDREVLVEVVVRRRRRVAQGRCGDRGARRPRSDRCPGRTPGCANVRRHSGTGSRRWKCSLRGFARPGRYCRGRCSAARARSRRRRAPGARAASSAAPPAMAVPNGPGSRSAPKSSNRRRRRVCAPVAERLMSPTVSTNPPSSRSRSRPTSV